MKNVLYMMLDWFCLNPPLNLDNYDYLDSKIYINKDNYNVPNKTIIGSLILNDGQPCLNSTQKL